MWEYNHTPSPDELYHFGVKGMKWGRRKVRGHAGPGRYVTKSRQLAGDKKDLEALNKGQHLSAGLTKKRQAAYDARDRATLEKRVSKTEAAMKNAQKDKNLSRKQKKYIKKAQEYKRYAEDYDPKGYLVKLSDKERAKLQRKHDENMAIANHYMQKSKLSAQKDKKKR